MKWTLKPEKYNDRLGGALLYRAAGKLTKSIGLLFEAQLPGAGVGSLCRILPSGDINSKSGVMAEVVGFKDNRVILMPFEHMQGINSDSLVLLQEQNPNVNVSSAVLGRVINSLGEPIDDKGRIQSKSVESRSLYEKPSAALGRKLIREPLDLGVRSINGLVTCGQGQRVGIMAGSGVGKSVLLGMMARNTNADVNVIALIGERGREVREFVENDLGPEGLKKSVIVVATSDSAPILRIRGAFLAASIAEYFRDQGKRVLLTMDSVTRFSMAQREIGLAMGEPPATKGYTPSVFSMLPKLMERAGTTEGKGSITGLYSVLVEGDEMDDPIADSARSFLDGHIVLSRPLAQRNHFPAVDVLQSSSRVMKLVTDKEHIEAAGKIREWIAAYQQAEDLINLGAYVKGSNKRIDDAILAQDRINAFLRQSTSDRADISQSFQMMRAIVQFVSANNAAQAAAQNQPEGPTVPTSSQGFQF